MHSSAQVLNHLLPRILGEDAARILSALPVCEATFKPLMRAARQGCMHPAGLLDGVAIVM
jgi:hypothetical protein